MRYYVDNEQTYVDSRRRAAQLFRLENRLPECVFQAGYRACHVIDFDWLHTAQFWRVLENITAITGDNGVTWMVLEPHPSGYYRNHFGYFGVIQLPSSLDAEARLEVLAQAPAQNSADAVLDNARVVACYPDSGEWMVWGERYLGIALLAVRDYPETQTMENHLKTLVGEPLEAALELIGPNFIDGKVPANFEMAFWENYVRRSEQ